VLFLEPPIVALNALLATRDDRDIGMIGVSGGDWTTTWIAALDPRIRESVPVAGSLPLFLHTPPYMEAGAAATSFLVELVHQGSTAGFRAPRVQPVAP
jgi:hypothetical protein